MARISSTRATSRARSDCRASSSDILDFPRRPFGLPGPASVWRIGKAFDAAAHGPTFSIGRRVTLYPSSRACRVRRSAHPSQTSHFFLPTCSTMRAGHCRLVLWRPVPPHRRYSHLIQTLTTLGPQFLQPLAGERLGRPSSKVRFRLRWLVTPKLPFGLYLGQSSTVGTPRSSRVYGA